MRVVLPAPLGPMRPTQLAFPDGQGHLGQRVHAAEPDRQAADRQHVGLPGQVGALGPRGDPLPARGGHVRGVQLHLLVDPPVDVAGHAGRVLQQGEDEDDAAEEQEPVPAEAEPVLQRVREQRLGRDQAGEDRTGDQRDAAGVGEGDQRQGDERVVAVLADRAEVVGVQHAGDPGDDRGDGERVQLHRARVDRGGGRGALVGPDGEHLLAELAAPDEPDPRRRAGCSRPGRPSRTPATARSRRCPGTRPGSRGRGRRTSARAPGSRSSRRPRWCW